MHCLQFEGGADCLGSCQVKKEPVGVPKAKGLGFGGGLGGAKKKGGGLKKGGLGGLKKGGLGGGLGFAADDDAPKMSGLPSAMFSPPASPEASSPQGLSDCESEVDPLDAFMNGIESEVKDDVVRTAMPSKPSNDPSKQAISWDEIQKMGSQEQAGNNDDEDGEDDNFAKAFLNAIQEEQAEEERLVEEEKKALAEAEAKARARAKEKSNTGRFDEDNEDEYWVDVEEEENKYLEMLKKRKLSKELPEVDHTKIEYEPFERDFYIEAQEIKKMSEEELTKFREKEDNIRVRGRECPRPLKKFLQCGLPNALLKALEKNGCPTPFSIQKQALPAIMSGRDVIGVAKTGSGKTLAFVIPMLRHIAAQRPIEDGEGPIGFILAPTRELAVQIFQETKLYAKAINLNPVCAYGGAPISEQVAELKRGCEALVATPGRAVDLLCLNNGRVTNLRRVTYLVLDEADRMFDMGFEPQVIKLVRNIRPDRQTVLFSATFPKVVEKHARAILKDPIQIICGGGVSVVSSTIEQHIEIIDEHAKITRALELLKVWYDKGCILIFVDRQDDADELFRDLLKNGYPGLTLHGGKDQSDRDNTISDFKSKQNTLMIATSVAARGLDVKDLVLVINYSCPNHYEDYVHRVGRTGRAGRKGTAYTFITPEEDSYAGDMAKALKMAKLDVPDDLKALENRYERALKEKEAAGIKVYRKSSSSGYRGKGFKFDEAEGQQDDAVKVARRREAGETYEYDSNEEEEEDPDAPTTSANRTAIAPGFVIPEAPAASPADAAAQAAQLQAATMAAAMAAKQNANVANALAAAGAAAVPGVAPPMSGAAGQNPAIAAAVARAQALAQQISGGASFPAAAAPPGQSVALQQALAAAAKISQQAAGAAGMRATMPQQMPAVPDAPSHHSVELEINDYPQTARWKVTHKDSMHPIVEFYAVCVTTRGSWFATGRNPPPGERKLYLLIEGPDEKNVGTAKREIRRMLEEAAAGVREPSSFGRYSV